MRPTIGRIVHYTINAHDVDRIEAHRSYPGRHGNDVREGDTFPLLVTAVFEGAGDHVNGQLMLDGNDSLWVTSAGEGNGPGTWKWPPR